MLMRILRAILEPLRLLVYFASWIYQMMRDIHWELSGTYVDLSKVETLYEKE